MRWRERRRDSIENTWTCFSLTKIPIPFSTNERTNQPPAVGILQWIRDYYQTSIQVQRISSSQDVQPRRTMSHKIIFFLAKHPITSWIQFNRPHENRCRINFWIECTEVDRECKQACVLGLFRNKFTEFHIANEKECRREDVTWKDNKRRNSIEIFPRR